MIISLKGTTATIFNGEPTGEKDKLNVSFAKMSAAYRKTAKRCFPNRTICYFLVVVERSVEDGQQYVVVLMIKCHINVIVIVWIKVFWILSFITIMQL